MDQSAEQSWYVLLSLGITVLEAIFSAVWSVFFNRSRLGGEDMNVSDLDQSFDEHKDKNTKQYPELLGTQNPVLEPEHVNRRATLRIDQISICIPEDLTAELYRRAPQPEARTALVIEALRYFFTTHDSLQNELAVLNRHADELNQEAMDVLEYQVMP